MPHFAIDYQGVSIGFSDTLLEPFPTWTRIDTVEPSIVKRIEITRGRTDELDRTDTGVCKVYLNERNGLFDKTRLGSYDVDSRPLAIAIRNPVTGEWEPRFRGAIDELTYELHPSQRIAYVVITAVDWFDYLANIELAPGLFGDPVPRGSEGNIFFENTGNVQQRLEQMAGNVNVGIPPELASFFTGNVELQESIYSAGDSALNVMRDAAEAELPTIANLFTDRYGVLAHHGRNARFFPEATAATATHWDFHRWKVGDGAAIQLDPERAQVRPPFGYDRARAMVRNAALAYPMGIEQEDIEPLIVIDQDSIDRHGYRPWDAPNLLILHDDQLGLSAEDACQVFNEYVVENYKTIRNRVRQITVKSLRPEDYRAAATWGLLTGLDISDVVEISVGHPGGGGFDDEEGYVEGITETITPLVKGLDAPGYPMIELTADLSPATFWEFNPFAS